MRLAADEYRIRVLRGAVLVAAGRAGEAAPHFEKAVALGGSPEGEIGLAHIRIAESDIAAAQRIARALIADYSVEDFPPLRALADQLFPRGWMAMTADGRIVGSADGSWLRAVGMRGGTVLTECEIGPERKFELHLSSDEPVGVWIDDVPLAGSPASPPRAEAIEGIVDFANGEIFGWVRLRGHPRAHLAVRVAGADFETDFQEDRCRFRIRHDLRSAPVEVQGWLSAFDKGAPLTGSPLHRPELRAPVSRPARPTQGATVDVIVPVYAGLRETAACLDSLFAARNARSSEIIVIDDASPEPALSQALEARRGISLIRNRENLGFPASVNLGLALHDDRDVVILNSDAQVPEYWLDRLRAAAYSAPDIGIASPLSNEATILSYPDPNGGNPLPDTDFDALAARANAGAVVEIPTAVGFCMYIRRACLDAVGPFDATSFGRGYGEENDFCFRARKAGWRSVAAADLFVRHLGGVSFGAAKSLLAERNIIVLNRLHPGYDARIQDFLNADPLAPARRNIDAARASTVRRELLIVTLDRDGGVGRHVLERAEHGQGAFLLKPRPGGCRLADPQDPTLCNLSFDLPAERDALLALLRAVGIVRIEFHHILGHDPEILELPQHLGLAYDVVLHDYGWICPRVTLMDGRGRYCGMPSDAAVCDRCVMIYGREDKETIPTAELRRRTAAHFASAASVTAPCEDVRRRYAALIPGAPYRVVPWEAGFMAPPFPVPPRERRLRIAVIGAIGQQKGYDLLLACARDAAMRDLPVEFVVIGFSQDDLPLFRTGRVFVTGRYQESEAVDLIRAQNCDLAFFPSVSPETWSYALSLAWKAGLAAAAFDFGALAERIAASGFGWVIPLSADEAQINAALLKLVRPAMINPPKPGTRDMSELQSSGSLLPLAPGIYAFTLGEVGPVARAPGLPFPAIQLTRAPGQDGAKAEFLGTADGWLIQRGDVVVVQISGGPFTLILTTFRLAGQGLSAMPIECRRLDQPPAPRIEAPAAVRHILRTQILTHVQRRGDIPFVGTDWAGCMGQQLWIEAFAITPLEVISPDDIEYKGVSADGWETPWTPGGNLCGTRGRAVPITGFAVRLRGALAQSFECEYRGAFFNEGVIGPVRDGAPCRAADLRDPLEGIQLAIAERQRQLEPPTLQRFAAQ